MNLLLLFLNVGGEDLGEVTGEVLGDLGDLEYVLDLEDDLDLDLDTLSSITNLDLADDPDDDLDLDRLGDLAGVTSS